MNQQFPENQLLSCLFWTNLLMTFERDPDLANLYSGLWIAPCFFQDLTWT